MPPHLEPDSGRERNFDPAPDGEHLLAVLTDPAEDPSSGNRQINVVLNWSEELKQRVPTKQRLGKRA
jgi:hypothetical protein